MRQNPTIASGTYFGPITQGPRTRITRSFFNFDYLAASGFRERIDYKFLEAGHSFGAVDRDGGLAEGLFRNAEHLETPMDYADTINNSSLFPKLTWILTPQSAFKRYATWLRETYRERRKDIFNQAYRFGDTMYFNFGIGERVDPTDGGRTKCPKKYSKTNG